MYIFYNNNNNIYNNNETKFLLEFILIKVF